MAEKREWEGKEEEKGKEPTLKDIGLKERHYQKL
jgi:hypothetical protein